MMLANEATCVLACVSRIRLQVCGSVRQQGWLRCVGLLGAECWLGAWEMSLLTRIPSTGDEQKLWVAMAVMSKGACVLCRTGPCAPWRATALPLQPLWPPAKCSPSWCSASRYVVCAKKPQAAAQAAYPARARLNSSMFAACTHRVLYSRLSLDLTAHGSSIGARNAMQDARQQA